MNLERETVISNGVENTSALLEDFTPYVTTLNLEPSVDCIHKIQYKQLVLFEITTKSPTNKIHIVTTLEAANTAINGARLRKYTNRALKGL